MNKLEYINKIRPKNTKLLIRTSNDGENEWFVHYFRLKENQRDYSIYKTYTDNLNETLDDVIKLIPITKIINM